MADLGKTEKNEDQAAARLLTLTQLGYHDATDSAPSNVTPNATLSSSSASTRKDRRFRASSEIRRAEAEMASDQGEPMATEAAPGTGRSRRHSDDELLQMPARSYSVCSLYFYSIIANFTASFYLLSCMGRFSC